MREIIERKVLYEYNELSEKAKEKVKEQLLQYRQSGTFTNIILCDLHQRFPKSDLWPEYSLSCCQGDGLNLYGDLNFYDVLENAKEHFSDNELEYLKECFSWEDTYCLKCNSFYSYCIIDQQDIFAELIDIIESENIAVNYALFEKLEKEAKNILCKFCAEYEKMGYEFFYEITEEEAQETCSENEYEFLQDGTFYLSPYEILNN